MARPEIPPRPGPHEVIQSKDGKEVRLYQDGVVQCTVKRSGFEADFSRLPFRRVIFDYLRAHGPLRMLGTHRKKVDHLRHLADFLGDRTLTSTTYGGFLVWLAEQDGMGESYQRSTAADVAAVYESGIGRHRGWSHDVHDDMRVARRAHFRGLAEREKEKKQEKAISFDELARLMRAIRLEIESCERRLAEWRASGDPVPLGCMVRLRQDPNPYVAFALLAALEAFCRSEEYNALEVGDDTKYAGHLYCHAPNKDPRKPTLSGPLRVALDLATAWSEPLRAWVPEERALLLYSDTLPPEHRQRPHHRATPIRVKPATGAVLSINWLRSFYQRYFERTDPRTGLPVLYRDPKRRGEPLQPFQMSLRQAREVGITFYATVEEDIGVVQKNAGHRYRKNTEKYYYNPTERDRLEETAKRLLPMAERIRMLMRGIVLVRSEADERRVGARGALIPLWRPDTGTGAVVGECAEVGEDPSVAALAAGFRPGCVRSGDCRICNNFKIYADRRPLFVAARDWKLKEVVRLRTENNLREAENQRESAALDQAIIDAIDDYYAENAA